MKKFLLLALLIGFLFGIITFANAGFQLSGATVAGIQNTKASVTVIVIYVIPEIHNGDFGGRIGYDAWCAARVPSNLAPFSPTNIRAFVSVSATDEIRDMPDVYGFDPAAPIYWWHNDKKSLTKLANNWADMLDYTILASQIAGTGFTFPCWTGSLFTGAFYSSPARHCTNWTSSSSSLVGENGAAEFADGRWLERGSGNCSTGPMYSRAVCTVTFP